jgi:lipopolysaccharide export system protein LptA
LKNQKKGGAVQQVKFFMFKIWRFPPFLTIALITTTMLISGISFSTGNSMAEEASQKQENTPIQITAEQLEADNEKKFAEFIGNVKAIQDDFVITSDKLRIYYRGELLNSEKEGNDEELVKKIVATGNVKIKTDRYNAETEELEYDTAAMTIILSGENSKVIDGKNSITGSKIILYRKDNRVKVLGSKKKRIKAEFFSQGKSSDAFKIGPQKK